MKRQVVQDRLLSSVFLDGVAPAPAVDHELSRSWRKGFDADRVWPGPEQAGHVEPQRTADETARVLIVDGHSGGRLRGDVVQFEHGT